jgi:C4-dicarboxylate transporter, DctQ subunit
VPPLLDRIERLIDRITAFGAAIGGVFIGVMTVIVTYAVVTRYLFNRPIGWSEEISIYLMIWAVYLGTAYTFRGGGHIGVDLLMNTLPPKAKPYFHCFHYLAGLLFLALLFVKGIEMVRLSILLDNRSLAIDFPIYLAELSVPLGAALLMMQLLLKLIKLFTRRAPGAI